MTHAIARNRITRLLAATLACLVRVASGGTIILSGGGDLGPEILNRFQLEVRAASHGNRKSGVIWIPTAIPGDHPTDKQAADASFLHKLGMEVRIVHAPEGNLAPFLEHMKHASGAWISGGDPQLLIKAYRDSPLAKELKKLLADGGVIAGDSAGAGFLASFVVCHPCAGAPDPVLIEDGLGILPRVAIDSHLTTRGRILELPKLLADHRSILGLGIDENTAAVIAGGTLEVIGAGIVAIYKTDSKSPLDKPTYTLSSGSRFDWTEREVMNQ